MKLQRLWNDPVWSKVIATAVAGAGVALGAWAWTFGQSNPWTAGIGLVIALVAVGSGLYLFLRPPVVLKTEHYFLGCSGSGQGIVVHSLQVSATNRSGKNFKSLTGNLVSLVDGSALEVQFNIDGHPTRSADVGRIPARSAFQLVVPFGDMPEPKFLGSSWTAFRLEIEVDGHEITQDFPRRKVLAQLDRFRKDAFRQRAPGVTLREPR